jgi:hypothetical protein
MPNVVSEITDADAECGQRIHADEQRNLRHSDWVPEQERQSSNRTKERRQDRNDGNASFLPGNISICPGQAGRRPGLLPRHWGELRGWRIVCHGCLQAPSG